MVSGDKWVKMTRDEMASFEEALRDYLAGKERKHTRYDIKRLWEKVQYQFLTEQVADIMYGDIAPIREDEVKLFERLLKENSIKWKRTRNDKPDSEFTYIYEKER